MDTEVLGMHLVRRTGDLMMLRSGMPGELLGFWYIFHPFLFDLLIESWKVSFLWLFGSPLSGGSRLLAGNCIDFVE
jgi:hypothetical protein